MGACFLIVGLKGAYGEVKLATAKESGVTYAIKVGFMMIWFINAVSVIWPVVVLRFFHLFY